MSQGGGLWTAMLGSAGLYGMLAWLSIRFEYGSPTADRPLLAVLSLLAILFLIYFVACLRTSRAPDDGSDLAKILLGAVLFRLLLWGSAPIQEVDLYRYLWDGQVATQGISPYRYTPLQIRQALPGDGGEPQRERLVAHVAAHPPVAKLLSRVHFPELPTVYPTASQAVFAAHAWLTPDASSIAVRRAGLKFVLMLFDLATIWIVIRILKRCRLNPSLVIVYAWCPLVIKEFSNSGHLDSIAVFLSMCAMDRLLAGLDGRRDPTAVTPVRWWNGNLMASAILLALAVGAKLYPVVLIPLFIIVPARRLGLRPVVLPTLCGAILTLVLIDPLIPRAWRPVPPLNQWAGQAEQEVDVVGPAGTRLAADPGAGIAAFVRYWEMNDLAFMVVVENLKSAESFPERADAWFSVVPESVRHGIETKVAQWTGLSRRDVPFLVTRFATSLLLLLLTIVWAWKAGGQWGERDQRVVVEAAFLTIAWFWLLLPTQNPWYWTWALPLLPVMRNRAWLLLSGLVLIYYFRFWLEYHAGGVDIPGWIAESFRGWLGFDEGHPQAAPPHAIGTNFFDMNLVWLEFGPFYVWLWVAWRRRASNASGGEIDPALRSR